MHFDSQVARGLIPWRTLLKREPRHIGDNRGTRRAMCRQFRRPCVRCVMKTLLVVGTLLLTLAGSAFSADTADVERNKALVKQFFAAVEGRAKATGRDRADSAGRQGAQQERHDLSADQLQRRS